MITVYHKILCEAVQTGLNTESFDIRHWLIKVSIDVAQMAKIERGKKWFPFLSSLISSLFPIQWGLIGPDM